MPLKHAAALALTLAAATADAEWRYEQDVHPATGKASWYAEIESVNTVSRPLPHPRAPGSLLIWESPQGRTMVGVSVELGELPCDGKAGCQVLVQFDGGVPVPFHGMRPVDEAADSVLLQPVATFLDRARQAQRLRVTLPSRGAEQWLEFESRQALRWPLKKP